eukprot:SAG31_NODE_1983_length_6741_cov_6.836194_3_plen_178_part_00
MLLPCSLSLSRSISLSVGMRVPGVGRCLRRDRAPSCCSDKRQSSVLSLSLSLCSLCQNNAPDRRRSPASSAAIRNRTGCTWDGTKLYCAGSQHGIESSGTSIVRYEAKTNAPNPQPRRATPSQLKKYFLKTPDCVVCAAATFFVHSQMAVPGVWLHMGSGTTGPQVRPFLGFFLKKP